MLFTFSLLALACIPSIVAVPSPNSIVLKIGGENVTISSAAPVEYVTGGTAPAAKAIYLLSNDPAGNAVIALTVAADGTVAFGSSTLTGGAGASGVENATSKIAGPDPIFSQGAVTVSGNIMIAVNPGDNTMTMFTIDADDATRLTMVGQPVHTQGEFPVSVTISAALGQACVANGGATAGVACFAMSTRTGLGPLLQTALRAIPLNQTTPPRGPLSSVSQVFFNDDSTGLLTIVKGNPPGNNGFVAFAPVHNGSVDGAHEVRSTPAGTAALFGTVTLPGNDTALFATEAFFGAAIIALDPATHVATTAAETRIADQGATCWAARSDVTRTVFVTDVSVNHLVEIDYASGHVVRELNSTNGNAGMTDLVAAGNFVYALSAGNRTHVAVFDVSAGRGTAREIQNFLVPGAALSSVGMAFA